ncbi:MAG: right-handed parallel beta-helix repeat-containing protein [Planctomycetota bacterium]
MRNWLLSIVAVVTVSVLCSPATFGETYKVDSLDALEKLVQHEAEPGDVIELEPGYYYFEKDRIRCNRSGTPDKPIIVRGIIKDGKSPVIDAIRVNVKRCVFNVRPGVHDIVFENMEIKNCAGSRYPDAEETYGHNAGAFYFENCHNITCRNIESHHNEDGFFATHGADCILIENCEIHHNGTEYTGEHNRTHNFYFCAERQIVRNCYIHHSTEGENFKSRAANTIFAYNWVDEEAIYSVAVDSGGAKNTLWVGNVVMKRTNLGHGQGRLLGIGDGTGVATGTLVALNNTFITIFPRDFYLFTEASSTCDAILLNNVFAGPGEVFLDKNGKGTITGSNNWLKAGIKSVPEGLENTVSDDNPGFVDAAAFDFRLKADSPLIDGGLPREKTMEYVKLVTDNARAETDVKPSPIWLNAVKEIEESIPSFEPIRKGYGFTKRADDGKPDIGAYEYVKPGD